MVSTADLAPLESAAVRGARWVEFAGCCRKPSADSPLAGRVGRPFAEKRRPIARAGSGETAAAWDTTGCLRAPRASATPAGLAPPATSRPRAHRPDARARYPM